MAGKLTEAVAGLDIGSNSIIVAASPVSDMGQVFTGCSDAVGMRRGLVADTGSLAASVKEALYQAEVHSGIKIGTVRVGFSGHSVEFSIRRTGSIIGKGKRVTPQDIERLKRLALVEELPPGRRIISMVPMEFYTDGNPSAMEPSGDYCSRLEIKSLVITADNSLIEQLTGAVLDSGVKITDFLPSAMAAGDILLDSVQTKLGTALIDIGGSCTTVLLYNHGFLQGIEVLPVGGDHITSDLAICLRTTLEGAEEIKINQGLEPVKEDGGKEIISFPRLSGTGTNQTSAGNVREIIEARTCELFDMVRQSLNNLYGDYNLSGGLVLTGGGSFLKGLDAFAAEYLGVKVRKGTLDMSGRRQQEFSLNMAGAIGLLRSFEKNNTATVVDYKPQSQFWSMFRGIFRVSK